MFFLCLIPIRGQRKLVLCINVQRCEGVLYKIGCAENTSGSYSIDLIFLEPPEFVRQQIKLLKVKFLVSR